MGRTVRRSELRVVRARRHVRDVPLVVVDADGSNALLVGRVHVARLVSQSTTHGDRTDAHVQRLLGRRVGERVSREQGVKLGECAPVVVREEAKARARRVGRRRRIAAVSAATDVDETDATRAASGGRRRRAFRFHFFGFIVLRFVKTGHRKCRPWRYGFK